MVLKYKYMGIISTFKIWFYGSGYVWRKRNNNNNNKPT